MADKAEYIRRIQSAEVQIEAHFADATVRDAHQRAERALANYAIWTGELQNRPELAALNAAADELDSGLHNLAAGQYREAYGNLRLNLELSMATVHFSIDEFALRRWLKGKDHIVWSDMLSEKTPEKHLFTSDFVGAFNDEMGDRWAQFKTLANTVHRELSTHVHGAAATQRASREPAFQQDKALDWFEKCENGHLAWQYIALARYSDLLRKKETKLPDEFIGMLEHLFQTIDSTADILRVLGKVDG
jgi:hypothetical protein